MNKVIIKGKPFIDPGIDIHSRVIMSDVISNCFNTWIGFIPEKLESVGYPLCTEKQALPVWEKGNSFWHDCIHGKTVLPEHYRHGIM
jgi:signal-transduction protein with cAMP-binding, CBS, and nucleotidyltransferase domain